MAKLPQANQILLYCGSLTIFYIKYTFFSTVFFIYRLSSAHIELFPNGAYFLVFEHKEPGLPKKSHRQQLQFFSLITYSCIILAGNVVLYSQLRLMKIIFSINEKLSSENIRSQTEKRSNGTYYLNLRVFNLFIKKLTKNINMMDNVT
jgi:hypothetical protein